MKKILGNPIVKCVLICIVVGVLYVYSPYPLLKLLYTVLPIEVYNYFASRFGAIFWETVNYSALDLVFGVILCFLFKRYRPILKAFSPKLKGNNLKNALITGTALGAGLCFIIILAALLAGDVRIHFKGLDAGTFVLIFIMVFIAAAVEEFYVRGFIYQILRKNFPKWPAVAVFGNGIMFLVMHLLNKGIAPISMLCLVVLSVLYAMFVYYFDSIWITIWAHTTWNFMQACIFGLSMSGHTGLPSLFVLDFGTKSLFFDPVFGIEGSVFAVALLSIVSVGIFLYGRKKGPMETNIWVDES